MNPADNIGLTDFLVLVYRFFIRNFKILAASIILGLCIGGVYSYQKKTYYTSELIGFSPVINENTLLEILGPLKILSEEKNYTELSRLLNITEQEASDIRTLNFAESRHLKTSNAPNLTDKKLNNLVLVQLDTYNQGIYQPLAKGLQYYLNNNAFITSRLKLEKQKKQALIVAGKNYLQKLDSSQVFTQANTSKVTISNQTSPVDYNMAQTQLENLKIDYETLNSFTIVLDFFNAKKPSNQYIFITSAIFISFLMGGLLLSFLLELRQLARD